MTPPPDNASCDHCLLPLGRRGFSRAIGGESARFCCYGCCIAWQVRRGSGEASEAAWLLVRFGVGSFLAMNVMLFSLLVYAGAFDGADRRFLPEIDLLLWALATPTMLILGGPFARETWSLARQGRVSPSALIVIGAGAAYLHSTLAVLRGGGPLYFDTATMVLMLFTLGRYLEAAGRARAVRDLAPLFAAERASARVVEGEREHPTPVSEVRAGTLVRVGPGERVPVDGVIVEGCAHISEAVITGESRQLARDPGATVFAGSVNLDGVLLVRSSRAGDQSRWAHICRSVRDALRRRGPTQRIADQVVAGLVPVVLALAALACAYWAQRQPVDRALLAGLSLLVVACPCAVGLAAPLALSLGLGQLARHGCVVRSPAALEALARARIVAFDKTGTLTEGCPSLVDLVGDGVSANEVLARLAGLERHAEHALARAITGAAAARGLEPVATDAIEVVPGRGVRGRCGKQMVAAGSAALLRELGWALPPTLAEPAVSMETRGLTVVFVGWAGPSGDQAGEGAARAVLAFEDGLLPEARSTVAALRRLGIEVALLTGDLAGVATRVAAEIDVQECRAGLPPDAKLDALRHYRLKYGPVAMVGDGLNDGPSLAGSDVGVAVGSATELARETAEIVLPADGLWMLPWVFGVALAVRSTVRVNLAWAFGYNLIALTLAGLGTLQPIFAASVMAGSSLLVVLNSLRLERISFPRRDAADCVGRCSNVRRISTKSG